MEYDKIFDNATVKDLDFEVIFDEEDSIIEQVVGFGENGESLIGRDPEELTTDNDDSKVDIEGSSSDTTLKDGDGAEIKESGEIDLDNLFEGAECGLEPGKGGDAEEQTDETDKKDILAEPDEIEDKDFHDESVDLDNLFSEAEIEDTDDDDILDGSEEGTKEDKLSEAEEQTDETDKKDVLAEPDEIEDKDFHDESVDLDNLFTEGEDLCPNCGSNPCKCGLEPGKGGKAEEQTDETDKKDILAEPDEIEGKDFHDESVDLDKLFEGCGEGCEEGCSEEGEDIPATDAVEDDEEVEESYNIGGAKHINWFAEESIEAETDTEDELINAADNNDSAQNLNLDYQVGIDDEVIDDLIGSDI